MNVSCTTTNEGLTYFLGYFNHPSILGSLNPSVTSIATVPSSRYIEDLLLSMGLDTSSGIPHVFESDWQHVV